MSNISKEIQAIKKQIDSIDSCKALAKVQKSAISELKKVQESLSKSLQKLQPMSKTIEIPTKIEDALGAIQDTIKFVNNLVSTVVEEIAQLQKDIAEVSNAITEISLAITAKATMLNCNIESGNIKEPSNTKNIN